MRWLFFLVVAMLVGLNTAWAEPRLALVIGNGAYRDSPLANPPNDVRLIAETLRSLDFEVVELGELDRTAIEAAVLAFTERLDAAGESAIGLFYYAGHGFQLRGTNYLLPIGATLGNENSVGDVAISASWVLQRMETARNAVNLLILDACRNNPYLRGFRSATRGLARMATARGTQIAYATRPGALADDGAGRNSPYTAALSAALRLPGMELQDIFRETRAAVIEVTNGRQTPWEEGGLTAPLYLQPAGAVATATTATTIDREALFWQSIEKSEKVADYNAYLRKYPDGDFAALAQARIASLKQAQSVVLAPATAALSQLLPIDQPYQALKNANVRVEPSAAATRVATIARGNVVHVAGKVRDKPWYLIERDGKQLGYVYQPLLGPAQQTATLARPRPLPPATGRLPRPEKPGDVFQDCDACPEMIVVPPGRFRMGDLTGDGNPDERPVRDITIAKALAVSIYEITLGEWQACIAAGACEGDIIVGLPRNRRRQPAVGVSWEDAQAYLRWLGNISGQPYRLLSESEWEYVARAGTDTAYWWGPDAGKGNANCGGCGSLWDNQGPAPAGSFPANRFGLHDVHGNVWEWVADCWNASYADAPANGQARADGDCTQRVVRGGSWLDFPRDLAAPRRFAFERTYRGRIGGFRVARPLD